jgi:multiple sugar transport system permease protein
MINSLLVTVPTVVLSLLLASAAAFALSRYGSRSAARSSC